MFPKHTGKGATSKNFNFSRCHHILTRPRKAWPVPRGYHKHYHSSAENNMKPRPLTVFESWHVLLLVSFSLLKMTSRLVQYEPDWGDSWCMQTRSTTWRHTEWCHQGGTTDRQDITNTEAFSFVECCDFCQML